MVGRREYEDEHRLFVQGIMSKGVLNKDEVGLLETFETQHDSVK